MENFHSYTGSDHSDLKNDKLINAGDHLYISIMKGINQSYINKDENLSGDSLYVTITFDDEYDDGGTEETQIDLENYVDGNVHLTVRSSNPSKITRRAQCSTVIVGHGESTEPDD